MKFYECVYDKADQKVYMFIDHLHRDLEKDEEFRIKSKKAKIEFYLESAKSIKELHSLGYVHNEIKPGNVMISNKEYGTPKLIDF